MLTSTTHRRRLAPAVILALAIVPCASVRADTDNGPTGFAARALNVTDTAHLHYVASPESELLEKGVAAGQLPGSVTVRMNVEATVTASFTIHTSRGNISGTGSGRVHSSGLYASFGGTMSVSHGTGLYAHAHGHGGFYGTINRSTYAVVVQTTGTLRY